MDSHIIREMLTNMIYADESTDGASLLEKILILEGTIIIRETKIGESNYLFGLRLYSILGDKYVMDAQNLAQQESAEIIEQYLSAIANRATPQVCAANEKKLLTMEKSAFQDILNSFDVKKHGDRNVLVAALFGLGYEATKKFLECISLGNAAIICEDLDDLRDLGHERYTTKNAVDAQKQILSSHGE